jgi:hypothetical protein
MDRTQIRQMREEAKRFRKWAREARKEAAELRKYARRICDESEALFAQIGAQGPPSRAEKSPA